MDWDDRTDADTAALEEVLSKMYLSKKEEQDIEFVTVVRNNFLRMFKAAGHDVYDVTAEPGTLHNRIVERLAGRAAR